LTRRNFPKFAQIVNETESIYLTQTSLSLDPLDFNVNTELHILWQVEDQDTEISRIFTKSQEKFGTKNVLGILAWKFEEEVKSFTVKILYAIDDKVLMHFTQKPPILSIEDRGEFFLMKRLKMEVVEDVDKMNLEVLYEIGNSSKVGVSYSFRRSSGWWTLDEIEVEMGENATKLRNSGEAGECKTRKWNSN
jgi:hypothetical protein